MKQMKKRVTTLLAALAVFCTSFVGLAKNLDATDPIIIPFKRFGLEWSTDLPEHIDLLRVWYTLDNGSSWQLYSETQNPSSPAPVKVSEDGRYGFYTQARDVSGLEENPPVPGTPPKVVAIIDTLKPALVLVTPNTSETFSNSQDVRIQWNASDINFGPAPLQLFFSKDGGGTWEVIKKGLPNTGTYVWKLPTESSEYYRTKVVASDLAGNESEDVSDANFRVDGKPPVTRVTGPTDAKSPVFDVTYNAQDLGGAGLAKVQIYFQIEGEKVWHLYGEDKDLTSPFRFEAKRGGRYGFKMVGTDRVGNSEPIPDASTRPDIWVLMDSIKPVVRLTSFKGSKIKPVGGKTVREITWSATDDNMSQSPITLELSTNDGATYERVVVTDFQNSGRFPWTIPSDLNIDKARIRITALDVLGNKGVDVSDPFSIDSTPPTTVVNIVTWNDDNESHKEIQPTQNIKMANPNAPAPKLSVAELLTSSYEALKTNDLFTTEELAKQALAVDPDNYQVHALLGRLYFRKELTKKSELAYARSIELNSNYEASRIGLAVAYYTQGQEAVGGDRAKAVDFFKKAALQYEAAIQITPDNWDEYFNLGYIYARLQRYEDALIYLKKATTLTSDNGDAHWFMGQVHEKLQQSDKALEAYKKAAQAYPPGSANAQKAEFQAKKLSQ
jgi:Tfp pilus assembly protein PilF